MNKAERTTEQMCEACWMHNDPECGYECRNLQRKCTYNDLIGRGYELAEKDLALSWEDAQLLHIITEKYMRELDNRIEAYPSSSQELFEEVLRRFNEKK